MTPLDNPILDLWAQHFTQRAIAIELKIKQSRVQSAISRARCRGDERALRRSGWNQHRRGRATAEPERFSPDLSYSSRYLTIPGFSTEETRTCFVALPRLRWLEREAA